MPGVGLASPRRSTASATAVKRRRRLDSGTRGALAKPSSIEHLRAAARGGDQLAGALAECLQPNRQRVRQRPVGEALDGVPTAHQAARAELLGPHRAARREGRELAQVDDGVGHARNRAEAALRQPALERHLAALVAGRAVAPRARAPPLVATAGRLALARAGPAADALRLTLRAGGGMEVAEIHGLPIARAHALTPPPPPGAPPRPACRAPRANP